MANDIRVAYRTEVAATITLASLASDTNLLAGRSSLAWDNTTNLDTDLILSGKITTGTSPTAAKSIELWALALMDDTPTWPDTFDGTDKNVTITSSDIKNALLVPLWSVFTSSTSNQAYPIRKVSIANAFGFMPSKGQLFVVHNTGVNLNGTGGNHEIVIKGVHYTFN